MDFSKAQIAALVLGYLKSENLQTVVDEFLKCCPYFTENHQNIKMGKYFITRVSGMCLIDFLEEYAVIYSIVQGRLEETNYYKTHGRTSLVEQIMYLLEKGTGVANMTTSIPVSTLTTSEVYATPAHTFPGNNDENDSINKAPKKRPNKSKDKEEIFDVSEVLTQTLPENHEKIAKTINIVRNTTETLKTQEENTNRAANKLDALIKTVVQLSLKLAPFTEVLVEQLRGVDLISLPTPKIPITTSSALTPNDQALYNSTSSSYYQPSQNKSIDQLMEECHQLDNKSPPHEDFSSVKILSDVVTTQDKHTKLGNTTLKNFNANVIDKKNLNLLNNQTSESWSKSSSGLDMTKEESNKTVISKDEVDKKRVDTAENISSIINEVEVKNTLVEEKKNLLSQLEEVRQTTFNKMKNSIKPKKTHIRHHRKSTETTKRKRKEEAQKLVKGFAQRGIYLLSNKNLQKPKQTEELCPKWTTFDIKTFSNCETVIHDDKKKIKSDVDIQKIYDEETAKDVTRILKWTDFGSIFDLKPVKSPPRKKLDRVDDELMDYVLSGDCRGVSPEKTKGERKKKLKNSESDIKQTEKISNSLQNLLKNIDVEMFLDKVHYS